MSPFFKWIKLIKGLNILIIIIIISKIHINEILHNSVIIFTKLRYAYTLIKILEYIISYSI